MTTAYPSESQAAHVSQDSPICVRILVFVRLRMSPHPTDTEALHTSQAHSSERATYVPCCLREHMQQGIYVSSYYCLRYCMCVLILKCKSGARQTGPHWPAGTQAEG